MPDIGRYVQDGEGAFFEVKIDPATGEAYYEPAPKGLAFQPMPGGSFVAVRDVAEAQRQASPESHEAYFAARFGSDPREAKQRLKRQDVLERQLQQMAVDRASPVGHPRAERIKDEQLGELLGQYQKAASQGLEKECDFLPLSTYAHKLITPSGRVVRSLLQGEVGMRPDGTILVLEPGYGGSVTAVKEELDEVPPTEKTSYEPPSLGSDSQEEGAS